MNKKITFLILLLFLTACSSSNDKKGVRFQNTNRKNYNDIQSTLKNDPKYSGAEKQDPNEFKKDDKSEKKEDDLEQVTGETGIMDKEELDRKRDEDIKDGIINISDGIFLPLVNDIYINKDEYIGKKVRIVGQVVKFDDPDTKETVYAVLREGPGCCYNDAVIGFEFLVDGEYPKDKTWIEMVGEVILDNYGTGKVVKLKALEVKSAKPKTDKIIHFNQ